MQKTVLTLALTLSLATPALAQLTDGEAFSQPVPSVTPQTVQTAPAEQAPVVTTTTTSTTTSTTEQLNGYVQQQVVAPAPVLQASDFLNINVAPSELREYSDRKYKAVKITVENRQDAHVELLQGELLNGLNEAQVAAEKQQSKARGRKAFGTVLGLASAVPGVGFMGAGSYAAHMALATTSNALSATRNIVENMPGGGQAITGQYVNRVNNVILSPKQTFTFEALLPRDANPSLKLIFKDLKSNQIYDLAKN